MAFFSLPLFSGSVTDSYGSGNLLQQQEHTREQLDYDNVGRIRQPAESNEKVDEELWSKVETYDLYNRCGAIKWCNSDYIDMSEDTNTENEMQFGAWLKELQQPGKELQGHGRYGSVENSEVKQMELLAHLDGNHGLERPESSQIILVDQNWLGLTQNKTSARDSQFWNGGEIQTAVGNECRYIPVPKSVLKLPVCTADQWKLQEISHQPPVSNPWYTPAYLKAHAEPHDCDHLRMGFRNNILSYKDGSLGINNNSQLIRDQAAYSVSGDGKESIAPHNLFQNMAGSSCSYAAEVASGARMEELERRVRSHTVELPALDLNTRSGRQKLLAKNSCILRPNGGKDRHSKVKTAKGLRDRRVRLSASTAIQFYDIQDRLGYDQPSKAVDWLMKKAVEAIDELPQATIQAREVSTSASEKAVIQSPSNTHLASTSENLCEMALEQREAGDRFVLQTSNVKKLALTMCSSVGGGGENYEKDANAKDRPILSVGHTREEVVFHLGTLCILVAVSVKEAEWKAFGNCEDDNKRYNNEK